MSFKVDENTCFDIEYSAIIKVLYFDNDKMALEMDKDCTACVSQDENWYIVVVNHSDGYTYQIIKSRDEKIAKSACKAINDAINALRLREAIKIVQEEDLKNMTTKEVLEKISENYMPEGQDTYDICNDYEDRTACYGEEFYD